MFRTYIKLVVIFGSILFINQQVSPLEDTMINSVNTHKEDLLQAVKEVLKTTDVIENNYDLLITESPITKATSSVKPVLWQGSNKPGLMQGLDRPGLREGLNRPVLRQGLDRPGVRLGFNRPGLRQDLDRPGLRQGLDRPGLRQGLNKPSARHHHHHHHHREPPEMVTPITRNNSNNALLQTVGVRLRRRKKKIKTSSDTTFPPNQENKMANTTLTDELNKNWREEEIQEEIEDRGNQNERVRQNLTDSYYRRGNFLDDVERNKPQRWPHCMDLISPRLKGYQDDWKRKQITNKDGDFKRLIYLLSTNTSDHTQKELEALLSQISGMRFRIFQWDYSAITTLLNVLVRGPQHTFRALKRGIKNLFESWHLDISMMRVFLDQIRIYRPPCINITGDLGYTKSGVVNLYTRSPKSTRKPRDNLQSCETREKRRT